MATAPITVESIKTEYPEVDLLEDAEIEREIVKPALAMGRRADRDAIEGLIYQAYVDRGYFEESEI